MFNWSTYYLLSSFARVVGHRVRGQLGIVQNDLSFIQTLIPEDETRRAIEKCVGIASFLKDAQAPLPDSTDIAAMDLVSVLSAEAASAGASFETNTPRMLVNAHASLFTTALQRAIRLAQRLSCADANVCIMLSALDARWTIAISTAVDLEWEGEGSLSEALCLRAGVDALEAPHCDAVFQAHGFGAQVRCAAGLLCIRIEGLCE